ncbi:MAG: TRAP transporter substrate-binding protein DctP [Lawsonibacter sp.]
MKKVKKMLALFAVLTLIVGCLSTSVMAAPEENYTIKVYCGNNPEIKLGSYTALDFIYQGALAFKNYCESNSSGRITVEIYPSGQLGSTQEALQQCMQGTLECVMGGDGETATLYPNIQAMSIPYLFDNRTEFYAMQDSDYMKSMYADIEANLGLKTLAAADNGGFRNFSNNIRPIHSAADLANLKIRTMESPIYSKMLESFNASATPMAYSELYSALQTGVVDGQENSPGTTLNGSFYEVNKYYILDGHAISSVFLYIGSDFYNSLPADLQKVVTDAGRTAQYSMRGGNCANEALALEALAANGMEIYAPTAEEKESFLVCQEPVIEWLKTQIGEETVDGFVAAVAAVKAGESTDATQIANPGTTAAAPASSMNTVTYVAIAVAVAAVLFAAYTLSKGKKKEQ